MNEEVLIIATAIASLIASPLIEGLKVIAQLVGWTIKDRVALWFSLGVSFACAAVAMGLAGVFSPPYPVGVMPWIRLVGGSVGSIFAVATVVFKQLIQPKKTK